MIQALQEFAHIEDLEELPSMYHEDADLAEAAVRLSCNACWKLGLLEDTDGTIEACRSRGDALMLEHTASGTYGRYHRSLQKPW